MAANDSFTFRLDAADSANILYLRGIAPDNMQAGGAVYNALRICHQTLAKEGQGSFNPVLLHKGLYVARSAYGADHKEVLETFNHRAAPRRAPSTLTLRKTPDTVQALAAIKTFLNTEDDSKAASYALAYAAASAQKVMTWKKEMRI